MNRFFHTASASVVIFLLSLSPSRIGVADPDPGNGREALEVREGQILFESIGQGLNFTPTTSAQYGYFSFIKGVDSLFAGTPENEPHGSCSRGM